jgi:hypothetical protein
MGLDMYLRASCYVPGYDKDQKKRFEQILELAGLNVDQVAPESPTATVTITVGYWRKANQIHSWFVTNVQDGKDECQESYVPREKLQELRDLCKTVIATKDHSKLEPKDGFFFGSTDIDDWYWEDLKRTVEMIDRVLKMDECWEFRYRSIW